MSNSCPTIQIDNLSFGYSPKELILKNVSLSIKQGQFIGIIGPNGGGKSTLLKLILGFLTPLSGKIVYNGTPRLPKNEIAYVPQSLQLDKQFPITVIEVIVGGRASHLPSFGSFSQNDYQKAYDALEKVGLLHIASQPFGTLSGGQAQRVLIARALASNPSILLLDEPTASVDSTAETEVLQLIQSLAGSMTILMVTHDLRAALTHVDGIVCVQGGALFMQPKEICEHFALGLYHFPLMQTETSHFSHHATSLTILSTKRDR